MTWPDVALAAVGAAQVVLLALIASRQHRVVKRVAEMHANAEAANGGPGGHVKPRENGG